jgi:hypothetical protein
MQFLKGLVSQMVSATEPIVFPFIHQDYRDIPGWPARLPVTDPAGLNQWANSCTIAGYDNPAGSWDFLNESSPRDHGSSLPDPDSNPGSRRWYS